MAYCQDPRNVNKADNNDTEADAEPVTEGERENIASTPNSPETSVLRNDAKHLRDKTQSCRDLRELKRSAVTEEDLKKFKPLLPPELNEDVIHIHIMHADENRKAAMEFKENLLKKVKITCHDTPIPLNIRLQDDVVYLHDVSKQLDFVYKRSVVIFILATKEFCDDSTPCTRGYACWKESLIDAKCVFVIHTAPEDTRKYELPMELRHNLPSIDYWPESESRCYRAIQCQMQNSIGTILKKEQDLHDERIKYCEDNYEELKLRLEFCKSLSLSSIARGSSDSTEASYSGGPHQETNRKETDFRPEDGFVGFAFQQQSSCPENIIRESSYASKPKLQSNVLSDFDRICELVFQPDKSPYSKIEPLLSELSETQHIQGIPQRSKMQQHDYPQQQQHQLEKSKKALHAYMTSYSPEAISKMNSAGPSSKTGDGPLTAGVTEQQHDCPQQPQHQLEEELKKILHAYMSSSSPEAISKMKSAGPSSKTGVGPLTASITKQQYDYTQQQQHQLEEELKKVLHEYMTSSSPEAISKMNSARPSSKIGDDSLTPGTTKRGRKDGDVSPNVGDTTKPGCKADDTFPNVGNAHFSSRTEYGPNFHNHTTTNSYTTHNTKTSKVKMAKATNVFINCTVNQYSDKDTNEEDENDDEDDDKDDSEVDDTSNIF